MIFFIISPPVSLLPLLLQNPHILSDVTNWGHAPREPRIPRIETMSFSNASNVIISCVGIPYFYCKTNGKPSENHQKIMVYWDLYRIYPPVSSNMAGNGKWTIEIGDRPSYKPPFSSRIFHCHVWVPEGSAFGGLIDGPLVIPFSLWNMYFGGFWSRISTDNKVCFQDIVLFLLPKNLSAAKSAFKILGYSKNWLSSGQNLQESPIFRGKHNRVQQILS